MRNRLKGLDLIDRLHDELWMEVHDIVQETGIKTIPMEKKCKKAKLLSGEALQIAVKRRGVKNRFKGLDLIDRVPEELWMEVRDIIPETGIKTIPKKKKCKKAKMAVWGGLTNSCEKKRSETQRRKGEIFLSECRVPKNSKERLKKKKASSVINAKK